MVIVWLASLFLVACRILDGCLLLALEYFVLGPILSLRIRLMIWICRIYLRFWDLSEKRRRGLLEAIDLAEDCLRDSNSIFAKR